ncbi:MAG: FAD-dependent oxidoreductase [Planctomycetota bacterium]
MSTQRYDVVVVGLGSAGSRAAGQAHAAGARVLAIEGGERIGGLCILRGCMPTKSLLEAAHVAHTVTDAGRFGLEVGSVGLDFGFVMDRMRGHVERFRRAKENGVRAAGYEIRMGRPRFVDPHALELDGDRIEAAAFVLSTGSEVSPLPYPVAEGARVLTSDDMFLLEAPPARAVVLGAGAVGLEFAQWLARVGTEVTLANRSGILSKVSPGCGEELEAALAEEMVVYAPSRLHGVGVAADGATEVHLHDDDGHERRVPCDFVLNALGRQPIFAGLDVEALGLELVDGRVAVDERRQAAVPHVFVAGDAAGIRLILHEANLEGSLAGRNAARVAGILDGPLEAYDTSIPPFSVIFTDPPFACVGRPQVELDRAGVPYRKAVKRFPEQGRGICMGAEHGRIELFAEARGGADARLLGCEIVGPRADDLAHVVATALSLGATVGQFHRVPWYHPTLSESFIEVTRALL